MHRGPHPQTKKKSVGLNLALDPLMVYNLMGVHLPVIILDNGTIALTGGQPHAGTWLDARGQERPAVDLATLARAAGVERVSTVEAAEAEPMRRALRAALRDDGVSVVIARGVCPLYAHTHPSETDTGATTP